MKKLVNLPVFVLLAIALLTSGYFNFRQRHQVNMLNSNMIELLSQGGKNPVVTKYVRDTIEHTVFQDRIIQNNTSQKIAALGAGYADSIQKALKISIDKINQVTKINAKLVAQMKLKATETPTGQTVKIHKDKNLDLAYFPDTDSLKMQYDLTLNDVRYAQRKWLLGKPHNYIDLSSDDPRVTINGLKSFRLEESAKSRFGIGLSAGYGLTKDGNVIKASPYFGIGLNYNLIQF